MAEKNILESFVDYLKPKAHDAIDRMTNAWEASQQTPSIMEGLPPEHEELIQNLVMGGVGGGGAVKGVRQLALAMKGKIKDGRLIPNQPFRQGTIGETVKKKMADFFPKLTQEAIHKTSKEGTRKVSKHGLHDKFLNEWEKKLEKLLEEDSSKNIAKIVLPKEKASSAKNFFEKILKPSANDATAMALLFGLLGNQKEYEDVGETNLINELLTYEGETPLEMLRRRHGKIDQDYYEGETPITPEELAKIIKGEEIINYPKDFSDKARSWVK